MKLRSMRTKVNIEIWGKGRRHRHTEGQSCNYSEKETSLKQGKKSEEDAVC